MKLLNVEKVLGVPRISDAHFSEFISEVKPSKYFRDDEGIHIPKDDILKMLSLIGRKL